VSDCPAKYTWRRFNGKGKFSGPTEMANARSRAPKIKDGWGVQRLELEQMETVHNPSRGPPTPSMLTSYVQAP